MQFADCSWHFMHFKYVSYMQAEKIWFFYMQKCTIRSQTVWNIFNKDLDHIGIC